MTSAVVPTAFEARILATIKDRLGERVSTLHVCEGKDAHAHEQARLPEADPAIDAIGDPTDLDPT